MLAKFGQVIESNADGELVQVQESLMVRKCLVIVAGVGLSPFCFSQTTLGHRSSSKTQFHFMAEIKALSAFTILYRSLQIEKLRNWVHDRASCRKIYCLLKKVRRAETLKLSIPRTTSSGSGITDALWMSARSREPNKMTGRSCRIYLWNYQNSTSSPFFVGVYCTFVRDMRSGWPSISTARDPKLQRLRGQVDVDET